MAKWDNQRIDDLLRTILVLKNIGEAKKFFRDLLTEQELIEFGRRWQAAKMLNDKIPYPVIKKETSLSSRTIARVSKWLNDGTGGYRLVLKRVKSAHHRPSSFGKGLC